MEVHLGTASPCKISHDFDFVLKEKSCPTMKEGERQQKCTVKELEFCSQLGLGIFQVSTFCQYQSFVSKKLPRMTLYQHTVRCGNGEYQDCVLEWDLRRIFAIWGLLLLSLGKQWLLVHYPDTAQNLPLLLCSSCSQTAQSCGGFGLCYPCPAPDLLSEGDTTSF